MPMMIPTWRRRDWGTAGVASVLSNSTALTTCHSQTLTTSSGFGVSCTVSHS